MTDQQSNQATAGETLLTDARELRGVVEEVVAATPVFDMHTHLFAPEFGPMQLWGIDELLTYHYLIAELFRSSDLTPARFYELPKDRQADLIWEALFVRETPLSEATRGVVAVLASLGLDPRAGDLSQARDFFRGQEPEAYLSRVLAMAGVSEVVMTNDPFDAEEARIWESGPILDARFHAALRADRIINEWPQAAPQLEARGYRARADLGGDSVKETRRFLDGWIGRMKPLYLAVSLPDDFASPEDSPRDRLIREVILPTCREHRIPFAMMIGVRRAVNPTLRLAGDGLGRADTGTVERLCAAYPENRFLVTMLSRENQHELCVAARKFSNLLPFGCWWFLNNPSIIDEITRERLELLGTRFIPQHSDARILDQLIYKWAHSRRVVAGALADSYAGLLADGRAVTRREVERDVARLFSGNFRDWVGLPASGSGR